MMPTTTEKRSEHDETKATILSRDNFDAELAQALIDRGLATAKQIEACLKLRGSHLDLPLADLVVEAGVVPAAQVLSLASELLGVPAVDLSTTFGDATVLGSLPAEKAFELEAIPLFLIGRELTLVVSRPYDFERLDTIGFITGKRVLAAFALTSDIRRHLVHYYGEIPSALDPEAIQFEMVAGDASDDEITLETDERDRPVVRLVNLILSSAISESATDVHLEPQEGHMAVRFRVDGLLRVKPYQIPLEAQAPVISRIKILSQLDIAERRVPQDGKMRVRFQGRRIDVRVSSFPSVRGEKIVLRLLDKEKTDFKLDSIGMSRTVLDEWRRLLCFSEGILLVTGPTGSGKSSTLFASLRHLNRPDINIVTLEDPVEYELQGVTQGQVNNTSGFTFARGLRSILRQDPDVILVGEIRDIETAQIAVQAALTGHLVLATLHTNDAPSAVTRLLDLGVAPYLLASALRGVLAQRLIRRSCPHCTQDVAMDPAEEARFRPWVDLGIPFNEGAGCIHCMDVGYRGRTAVHELLAVGGEIKNLISAGASDAALGQAAGPEYVPLWHDGLQKIEDRTTTLRELTRVVQPDTGGRGKHHVLKVAS
jgi:type IV pilus assembly protein PilB